GEGSYRSGLRQGYRPGASGGWRQSRGGSAREESPRGEDVTMPGERFAVPPRGRPVALADAPFVAGGIADRGPLERGAEPPAQPRAREAREFQRQQEWRDQATRALTALKAEEGTGPVNAADLEADDEALADRAVAMAVAEEGETLDVEDGARLPTLRVLPIGISRKR